MVRGDPAGSALFVVRAFIEGGIEAAGEPVLAHHLRVPFLKVPQRREHDLGREGEAGGRRPWGQGAVVRPIRSAARVIAEEAALDTVHASPRRPRTVARRDPPTVLGIAL